MHSLWKLPLGKMDKARPWWIQLRTTKLGKLAPIVTTRSFTTVSSQLWARILCRARILRRTWYFSWSESLNRSGISTSFSTQGIRSEPCSQIKNWQPIRPLSSAVHKRHKLERQEMVRWLMNFRPNKMKESPYTTPRPSKHQRSLLDTFRRASPL